MSVHFVWFQYELNSKKVSSQIKLYQKKLRKIKLGNRYFLNKRKKLQEHHIDFIKSYCDKNKGNYYTLADIRLEFLTRFKNIGNISNTTISKWLNQDLNLRYKKTNEINNSLRDSSKKILILKSISIQIKLEEENYHLVYADESKYCLNSNRYFMWSSKGENTYLFQPTSYFDASFIVVFSSERIELLQATRSTFTAESFINFIKEIVIANPLNLIIIMDNAPIHRSKAVKFFWKAQNIVMLTIPAYCPFLNPCEKLILKIKSAARKFQRVGELVTLQTLKHIVWQFQLCDPEKLHWWKQIWDI